jgi:hypothetical protein
MACHEEFVMRFIGGGIVGRVPSRGGKCMAPGGGTRPTVEGGFRCAGWGHPAFKWGLSCRRACPGCRLGNAPKNRASMHPMGVGGLLVRLGFIPGPSAYRSPGGRRVRGRAGWVPHPPDSFVAGHRQGDRSGLCGGKEGGSFGYGQHRPADAAQHGWGAELGASGDGVGRWSQHLWQSMSGRGPGDRNHLDADDVEPG